MEHNFHAHLLRHLLKPAELLLPVLQFVEPVLVLGVLEAPTGCLEVLDLLSDVLLHQLDLILGKSDGFLLEGGDEVHHLCRDLRLDSGPPLGRQAFHFFQQVIGANV